MNFWVIESIRGRGQGWGRLNTDHTATTDTTDHPSQAAHGVRYVSPPFGGGAGGGVD